MTGYFCFRNCIDFTNAVFEKPKIVKGEKKLYYNMNKYKQKGYLDILHEIRVNFTLVQLMDPLGNVNHAISVVGYWIFDPNYDKALVLNRESLYIICDPSAGEEQVANFETLFYAVIYIRLTSQLKKEYFI